MQDITIWYSKESTVLADWFIANTNLSGWQGGLVVKKELFASDAVAPKDFHRLPARIKDILYLDSPDLIFSFMDIPFASLEISEEAGTGHNAFQRFGRVAAAIENGVTAFYIYPEAAWISRQNVIPRWDQLNPMIFQALEDAMHIHQIPALLYYFPTDFTVNGSAAPLPTSSPKGHRYDSNPLYPKCPDPSDIWMKELFFGFNSMLGALLTFPVSDVGRNALTQRWAVNHKKWMAHTKFKRMGTKAKWSPMSATIEIDTKILLNHLAQFSGPVKNFGDLITTRDRTVIYFAKEKYRTAGDPYTGAIAGIDYIACRTGRSYEQRDKNLVMAFGEVTIDSDKLNITGPASVSDYVDGVRDVYKRKGAVLLGESYSGLIGKIPRYMMQVRHGTTFTKRKDLRMFAYFCDAIIFPDGSLWREA